MELYSFEDMPATLDSPEGMKKIRVAEDEDLYCDYNFTDDSPVMCIDIVYSVQNGKELHLLLYYPRNKTQFNYPLLIYVPGSGWHKQDIRNNSSLMCHFVQQGYLVASVEYRDSSIALMPSQVVDVKNAVRYLVLNAAKYSIDTQRIAIMGDSSGGHTALMVGLTQNFDFSDDTYKGIFFDIKCIIDLFGITHLTTMRDGPIAEDHAAAHGCVGEVLGGRDVDDCRDEAELYSPVNHIFADKKAPPVLILHGNRDGVVTFRQGVELYQKLRSLNKYVEMVCFEDAAHWSGGFRSYKMLGIVTDFLDKYLK